MERRTYSRYHDDLTLVPNKDKDVQSASKSNYSMSGRQRRHVFIMRVELYVLAGEFNLTQQRYRSNPLIHNVKQTQE